MKNAAVLNLSALNAVREDLTCLWELESLGIRHVEDKISELDGEILNKFENNLKRKIKYVTQNYNDSLKILGLLWDTNSDVLRFDVQSFPDDWKFNPTKRLVLKAMLKIFDPIGFIAPFSIRMKMLLQETWQKGLQWDDNLPRDLKDAWENWCLEIEHLSELTAPEIEKAELLYWIKQTQKSIFNREIDSLKQEKSIEKDSKLYSLNPKLDENGRKNVKSVLKNCIICKKSNASPGKQEIAPLPKDRIVESPPFLTCAVDFAGPIYIKSKTGSEKAYIVLFTSAVTRAIHLEVATNLSTETFLLAFKRFISRRGLCKTIYSDNAKSFIKANKILNEVWVESPNLKCSNSLLKIKLFGNLLFPEPVGGEAFGNEWCVLLKHH
ncbi:integrase catalytic domain-containing protein [Trichonephila clavata]|uniref:Integrase catalytic domain-containing protein n=1 Tax=Trichonephila clavata TaxID=2740835 RepID=A0A8X6LYD6_TRICU|nr:integrase catalytic domain-containing protein [Trichonephila clavata]